MKKIFSLFILVAFTGLIHAQTLVRNEFESVENNYYTRYHWSDFNGDGAYDIFEIDFTAATLHIANGNSFTSTYVHFDETYFDEGHYAFNDYDNDGDVDILTTKGYSLVILAYDKVNGFSLVNTGITSNYTTWGRVFWADVDGDQRADIVHGRKIFLNKQGSFVASRFMLPEILSNLVFDDITGDGLPDIVTGDYENYSGTTLHVLVNKGDGLFGDTSIPFNRNNLKSNTITLIDADGDSDIDVFASDIYERGWVFRNNLVETGSVTFDAQQISSNTTGIFQTQVGDLNSDGLQDLVIAGPTALTVLTNTSTDAGISFEGHAYEEAIDALHSLELVDLDNDNDLDISMKGHSNEFNTPVNVIYTNDGVPGAAPAVPINLSTTVGEHVSLAWTSTPGVLYNLEVKRNGMLYKSSVTSTTGKLLTNDENLLLRNGKISLRHLPSGSYAWRVQAVSPSGRTSTFSTVNTFDIAEGPTTLTLEASALSKVKLCWAYNVPGNPSFHIFRGTSSEAPIEIAQVSAGTLCYEDVSVPVNDEVLYYVVAVDGASFSAPSNTVVHHSTLFVETEFGSDDPNIITSRCFPADYDMDGDYDLAFVGRISATNNLLLKNNGAGSFSPGGSMLSAEAIKLPYTEMSGPRDLDNDGDPDMVVITGEEYSWQKVSVYINNNGTFVRGFETPAYLGVTQLAIEDFNNDGRLDLLFSNTVGNSPGNPLQYQLLYQNSDGSFTDSKISFTASETTAVAFFKCADLNSDGFMDLLWMSSDKNFSNILINDGGAFTTKASILPVTQFMGVADYNADGIVDVMVRGNEGLNLYYGKGDFAFNEPKVIAVDQLPNGPTFTHADVDLNGLTDLLLSDGYFSTLLLNKGNGSFKASEMAFKHDWGSSFAITDFENDGDIDIVKPGNDGQHQGLNFLYKNQLAEIGVINNPPAVPASLNIVSAFGKTTLSWVAATDDLTPSKVLTYNLQITDSNGKVWLSAETNQSGTFRRRLGQGNMGYALSKAINNLPLGIYKARVQSVDGSFKLSSWSPESQFTISQGPTALTVERILLNKIKLTWTSSSFNETKVIVQRKESNTAWSVIAELSVGSTSYTDATLEYNKQYEYRVFEASESETTASSNIATWNTNMWVMTDTDIVNLYGSMDVADFTGDGKMEMILNGAMIYNGYIEDATRATFEFTGNGWMKRDVKPSGLTHTAAISFTDLNGDNNPDIFQHGYVWDTGYKTETFINNGDKTFSPAENVFTSGVYSIQSYFDYDMDNDLDITAAKSGTYPTIRELFRNDGSGAYTSVATTSCNACPGDVAVADFDRDGDEDVIRNINGNYEIYLNGVNGLVASGATFPGYDRTVAVTDYNADGLPDVVSLSYSSYTGGRIYKNLGLQGGSALQFSVLPIDLSSGNPSLLSADFDHDGRMDIVILSPKVKVLRNKGNDNFEEYVEPRFNLSLHVGNIVDFDNDGDLDIYVSGYFVKDYTSGDDRKAKIFLNQTIVAGKGAVNVAPEAPGGLTSSQDSLGVHLAWTKPTDDHTSASGLTYDVVVTHDGKNTTRGSHNPTTGLRYRLTPGKSTGLSTLNNLPVGVYTWRVQAVDGSYLGSALSTTGTFTFRPPSPVMRDTLIYKCGRTITLTAKGTNIRWYSDKALTKLLANGAYHPNETQGVYVTQTIDGYEGIPKYVRITILDKPAAPTTWQANPFFICEDGNGSRTLIANGENIKWYADQSLTSFVSAGNEYYAAATNATYFVTQTIDGCESQALAMQVKLVTIDPKLYFNENKIWTKEKAGNQFSWFRNGVYYKYTTVPYIPFDGAVATYIVVVTKGQCQESSDPFVTSEENITAIEDDYHNVIGAFPNPTSENVTLKLHKSSAAKVSIIDALGHTIHAVTLNRDVEHLVDVHSWAKGVYIILVDDGENKFTKRLVIF